MKKQVKLSKNLVEEESPRAKFLLLVKYLIANIMDP